MHQKILFTFLSLSLCCGSLTLALDDPGIAQPVKDAVDEASRRIAGETAAAIAALGANPSTNQIAAIVFKAVRSSPESVLRIVDAAVRMSPRPAIPEIVTAATAAVPNRWKQVTYRRLAALAAKKSAPDDSGTQRPGLSIGLSDQRSSGPGPGEPGTTSTNGSLADGGASPSASNPSPGGNSANGIPMTLAEAIARTAFDAEPSLSFSAVQAAVNAALLADPAKLLQSLESPRAASGGGDAGLSNYANEPLRTPKQPAVSQ